MLTTIRAQDIEQVLRLDPLMSVLATLDGMHGIEITSPKQGYFIGGLNSNQALRGVKVSEYLGGGIQGIGTYPTSFYVVDSPEQFIERYHQLLEEDERIFAVFFTPIRRAEQSSEGGWRWHKWGEYIGDKTPTTEYLYDEPDIGEVYTVHIDHVRH